MKRNGKIEFMRFVFCICVILFHIVIWDEQLQEKLAIGIFVPFYRGLFGVEFFFLVSGALMAKSIRSRIAKEESGQLAPTPYIGDETLHFLWKKVQALLPYHIPFCLLMIALLIIGYPDQFPYNFLDQFLSLFLLHRTGVCTDLLLGVEWYISAMLLVMALYYPLCKRYYHTFTHLVAPFAGLMILGYMQLSLGKLSGASELNGITYQSNLRALGEIAIGIACYEVALALSKKNFTTAQRALISCLELLGYGATLIFICSSLPARYEVVAFALLSMAVTLSFTQKGLLGQCKLFQNQVCCFLGAISTPLYLCQNTARRIGSIWLSDLRVRNRVLLVFALVLLFGVGSYLIWTWIQKQPNRNKIVTRLSIALVAVTAAASFVGYQLAV